MSKHQQPPIYSKRGLDNQWMNVIIGSHDLFCGCDKPTKHLEDILFQEKCRHFKDIGTTTATETGEETGDLAIKDGDLEELFKEEDAATG